MTKEQANYISFLLRLWHVDYAEKPAWRALLENPHTGERQGFANLKDLFAFLEAQMGETVLLNKEDPGET